MDYPVENMVLPRSRRNVVILLKPTVILLSLSLSLVMGLRISIYLGACIRRSVSPVGTPSHRIDSSVSCLTISLTSSPTQRHHFPIHRFSLVSLTHPLPHPPLHILDGQTTALLLPSSPYNYFTLRCPHAHQTEVPTFGEATVGSDSFYSISLFFCSGCRTVPFCLPFFAPSPAVLSPFLLFVHYIGR